MSKPILRVWVTLLNAFTRFLNSDELYNEHLEYKGDDAMSADDFHAQAFADFIDSINRVPKDIPAATEGTAYGEMHVKWALGEFTPEPVQEYYKNGNPNGPRRFVYTHTYHSNVTGEQVTITYKWNYEVALEVQEHFVGGVFEHLTETTLDTKYGSVILYGYVDLIRLNVMSDLKKTGKYDALKFMKEWQYRVYPMSLRREGVKVDTFKYIACTGDRHVYIEEHPYQERFESEIIAHVEALYEFIQNNRELITNKKLLCEIEGN